MSPYDLANLAALKAWLGLPAAPSASDATLAALVTAASRAILSALSRPGLLPQDYTELRDGDRRTLMLRHWPVLGVNAVTWNGIAVPQLAAGAVTAAFGYVLRPGDLAPPGAPQALDLFGVALSHRRVHVVIDYQAGYAVVGETQAVPAAAATRQLAALAPYGPWASDLGVTYAQSGEALTTVAGEPSAGQYAVSAGVYSFAAADAGASVSLSYGYVPQDLAQAALELAAERFRAAEHIGVRSKSLGGQETIAFDAAPISAPVLALIQPYRRVAG
jgi:hypothetical protein